MRKKNNIHQRMKRFAISMLALIAAINLSQAQTSFFKKLEPSLDFTVTPFKITNQQTYAGIARIDYPVSKKISLGMHCGFGVLLESKSKNYYPTNQIGFNGEFSFLQKQKERYALSFDIGDGTTDNALSSHYYYRAGIKSYLDKRFCSIGVQHLFFDQGIKSNSADLFISYGFKL